MRSFVTSIFLYACESWTLTAELQGRIQAMDMRCYRKILRISYKDHVTNEEVRDQQAIGPHEDLLTIVKRQTAVVWSCLQFIRSGQKHLARHSDRGKKTKRTKEEVGRQQQGMDRPGVCQVRGQWRTGKDGGNWLQNYLWCPNDLRCNGIDDDDEHMIVTCSMR